MKVTGRLVTGVLTLLALAGCRQHSNANGATDGGWGPVPGGIDAVRITVSPNPAPKLSTVTIDASESYGDITSFVFDFGDGSPTVTQSSPITTHVYDVVNYQDTHYTVKVTGYTDASNHESGTVDLLVKDLPPSISSLDSGSDKNAVIGEWITAAGKNFLAPPTITVDAVPAPAVVVLDAEHFKFRVPPAARAGDRNVTFTWAGYTPLQDTLRVKRLAVATSARYDKVYVMDVGATEGVTDTGERLPITDASTVKISPDGSTAYVTNGRFNFLSTGTVTVVDLTADGGPAVAGTFDVGNGPLYDIETAAKAPVLVTGDAFGIYVYDISDPLAPVQSSYVSALFAGDPLNDVAAADIAVSPDGSKIAVLNALSAQARVFKQSSFQIQNPTTPKRVNVGPKTQKAAISEDGTLLYVLGGGGEGAVPMDLSDPRAANITAIDISDNTLAVAPILAGPYALSSLNANAVVAPVPFDLTISRSNPHKVYVTTLDQGFTNFFDKLSTLLNDFTLAHLVDLINFLATGGLNFGDTIPVVNADGSPSLGTAMQSNLTAPTSADMLYNDHKMLQSAFRLWYDDNSGDIVFETGATVVDSTTHTSVYLPFESEALGFDAVLGLFTPPFSFGDCAFQP